MSVLFQPAVYVEDGKRHVAWATSGPYGSAPGYYDVTFLGDGMVKTATSIELRTADTAAEDQDGRYVMLAGDAEALSHIVAQVEEHIDAVFAEFGDLSVADLVTRLVGRGVRESLAKAFAKRRAPKPPKPKKG